ncbi:hypothetical protein OQA88_7782 [Cercophora sp. LCS_1]
MVSGGRLVEQPNIDLTDEPHLHSGAAIDHPSMMHPTQIPMASSRSVCLPGKHDKHVCVRQGLGFECSHLVTNLLVFTTTDMENLGDAASDKKSANHLDAGNEKERAILEACKWRNLDALRALAESSGGFLTDNLRQQASQANEAGHWKELHPHKEEYQVELDVDRAFVNYPENQNDAELARQKEELSALINEVLRRYPYLCYFQGYHDICQVFLLVLPSAVRAPAVARLSVLRIRDFMLPTLTAAIDQLHLIPDILRAADPQLWRHLASLKPFFALSGTLTMYAHDITTLGEITRLFDVLLAKEPVFSVYMFAAIVRSRRVEVFETPSDEPDMLHSILSKLPRPLDLEALIADACRLFNTHPPESLASWRRITRSSVLRTARSPEACAVQSMADGEEFFHRQVKEIAWRERRDRIVSRAGKILWQYRHPMSAVGLAVVISVAAVLLRRQSGSSSHVPGLLTHWVGRFQETLFRFG